MIDPLSFHFPAGRELKNEAGAADGDSRLEIPSVVEYIGALLLDVLVGDDVARRGCGKFQKLGAHIAIKRIVEEAGLDGVLLFHFVIFAVDGKCPALERGKFGVLIEIDEDAAEALAAFGPQDFADAAIQSIDFAGIADGGDLLVEKNGGDGIFHQGRQRFMSSGADPVGYGICAESRGGEGDYD